MLRWRCQSGVGNGTAIIPGGQITMLSCLAAAAVNTEIRIHMFDPIIVPPSSYFTIGAHEWGYLWITCQDATGKCFGSPVCDQYPGDNQIGIEFSGGPLTWFVSWIGCG